ncbi:hypothetical protein DTO166G4_7496 [Paecilomyces variotii]|nr:hypothetical protein DTO166G4_7496 [Paecilomyces variotii]KAJ9239248.1 hypothetical protein DTO166G5_2417 [Paecilomyces variotii]KAJ9255498.1 hypothetical protein DTO195F2_6275 [Paecilomyces variotii]KAJ9304501.1 hypothetical protein DTO217A2_5991 [Paecilomyces variotii]KAJ9374330.1 hypothetical protein DTO282E5_856 [Paecilomyces variotii]
MGAGSSKQEPSAGSKHVFASETPVQFSSNLVEALQSSAETDSSRAKSLELHIQARVAQELERIRQREQQTLAEIEKRLNEGTLSSGNTPTPPSSTSGYSVPTTFGPSKYTQEELSLDTPLVPFAGRDTSSTTFPAPTGENVQIDRDASRETVLKEIEQLKSKLEGRKRLAALDDNVDRARSGVVGCLKLNDRRPLDCWKEVEQFKKEVQKLEEAFVEKIIG